MSRSAQRWMLVGVSICVLGVLVLVGRAEYVQQTRPHWQFAVKGYDPRDVLRGQYLNLSYVFRHSGADTCGELEPEAPWEAVASNCCLCLTRTDSRGIDPHVRQVTCDEARSCDGWIRAEAMLPPIQYFVPEDRALDLERALQTHDAAIELVVDENGLPALVELHLGGRPWREALE